MSEHTQHNDKYTAAAKYIAERAGLVPHTAVVLGSGLSEVTDSIKDAVRICYSDIPHFPVSTAPSHEGALYCGLMDNIPVLLLSGRVHCYEGFSMYDAAFYVGLLARLKVSTLLLTNAAGAVNTSFAPGDIMLITDHIKLAAPSPLTGPHNALFGPRFPCMTEVYSTELRKIIRGCANNLGIPLKEGVYMYFAGPQYETPAEIRAAGVLGADAVGMSTVPEAIAACAAGIKTAALSVITNMAAGISGSAPNESEVTDNAGAAAYKLVSLIKEFVSAAG